MKNLKLKELYEQVTNKKITLPTVQRDFVWKSYQIENLWESLLRGYPIGSFVVSKKENNIELLDGQQRLTTICLGFYNPLEENQEKILKSSTENIQIFIDLEKPTDINRKYLFRVITKSHPWGYQSKENQRTLESKDRNQFLESQDIEGYDYLKKPLNRFYPYDATQVFPVGLLLESALKGETIQNLKNKIEQWKKKIQKFTYKKKEKQQKSNLFTLEQIYGDFKNMFSKTSIPLLDLVFDINQTVEIAKHQEDESQEKKTDDIEELFIRLNSGGTRLNSEEINYSILKSKISRDSQHKIEISCQGFIKPARFINITYQLFRNTLKESKGSSNLYLKPREFQRQLKDVKKFEDFLLDFFQKGYLKTAKDLLKYDEERNPKGLPTFVLNNLHESQEIMFILLYRLYIKKDRFDEEKKSSVLGLITLFLWLGKEERKGYKKLLKNIWEGVQKLNSERFWDTEMIDKNSITDEEELFLIHFPTEEDLNKMLETYKNEKTITNFKFDKVCSYNSKQYWYFYDKIFNNKDLVLYAQRKAVHKWFTEIEDISLEDHNRPFDWDHIAPQNWRNKRKIRKEVKEWYHTNGNIRALPFGENRSDSDKAPQEKLKDKKILEDSFCNKDWCEIDGNVDYKKNEDSKKVIRCIISRNLELCKEWYTNLSIDKFAQSLKKSEKILEDKSEDFFNDVLDRKKWKNSKDLEDENYSSIMMKINKEIDFHIWFYSENQEFKVQDILRTEYISFGLQSNENNGFDDVTIKDGENHDGVIYKYFTLFSYSQESKIELFQEFYQWLKKLPKKYLFVNEILEKFKAGLKSEYRDKIINSKTTSS